MLPKDPHMLASFLNLKLRDFYPSLDALCDADYTQGAVIRKVVNRLLLRYELGRGARATVCISYEGEAPRELCKLAPGGKQVVDIPLPPIPHDHFKIVIWGEGEVAIYALEVNVKAMAEGK